MVKRLTNSKRLCALPRAQSQHWPKYGQSYRKHPSCSLNNPSAPFRVLALAHFDYQLHSSEHKMGLEEICKIETDVFHEFGLIDEKDQMFYFTRMPHWSGP